VAYIYGGARIGDKGGVNRGSTMVGPGTVMRVCCCRRRSCCYPGAGPGYMLMVLVQGL
jgi:hypothetical protein